MAYSQM